MKKLRLLFFVLVTFSTHAQLYFPPLVGSTWETMSPNELNWCPNKIDSLYTFLESQNTKAFIVLKDGKIVLEQYFNGHSQSSVWYWASAGKTITSFLVGIAQQENFLDINNPSADYLGAGWTSCTPEQENAITVWHQLTMTSGLNDGVANPMCTLPACLQFLANAGSRWAYHNGPYTLLDQVIANATGVTLNQYTTQKLKNPTGITGSFIPIDDNMVYFSTARSMARFGLLILNNGNWNGNPIMTDSEYFNAMVNTSQELNRGYGYLWWLNGKANFMVPGSQFTIPGSIMPNAPADMVSGLGRDGQFLNVVPSQNLVLIRMGEEPTGSLVPFLMNDKIWEYMNELTCNSAQVNDYEFKSTIFPNPSNGDFTIQTSTPNGALIIFDLLGRKIVEVDINALTTSVSIPDKHYGVYIVQWSLDNQKSIHRILLK
jgi:CubicO group peptidase (beta-lactamase class C family)